LLPAQTVMATMSGDMLEFRATSAACPPTGTPTALDGVVVSALIHIPPQAEGTTPTPTLPPEMSPAEDEEM
ncbi:MAG TPA: hypothetical protein VMX94_04760, partial [Armatimonadota bacterium]|nr:hypothetical protein [Armatimonadota bacterium]